MKHIKAKKGKVFRRISDGYIIGSEAYLGKTYYLDGKLLDEPLDELPEHYEEVDRAIVDEEHPIVAPPDEVIAEIPVEVNEEESRTENEVETIVLELRTVTITAGDIVAMQEKIDKIIGALTPTQKKKLGPIQ
ncbi:MAG: hypothetical protein LBK45_02960 [Tannerellaceae bacterium]|jgi:hypothetical protein|nr:hypothetical protein [Tannerellaceae bacterium]